ncbi:MAG: class F sortase [bacterium]|nr:class F sortase [bacterium]
MVTRRTRADYLRFAMLAVGVLVLVVGAADLLSRAARSVLGEGAATAAFAPAIAIVNPSVLDSFSHSPATTTPLTPVILTIPAIGVKAAVEHVGKKSDGTMQSPKKFGDVAWYMLGSAPGAAGNAIIAGHVNNALTKAGVFEHLSNLKVGDTVVVSDALGNKLTYFVSKLETYPATDAPAASIFTGEGPSQLVLITCDGDWIASAHSFSKRFVVYARLSAQ